MAGMFGSCTYPYSILTVVRYVSVTWDVDALESMKEEIVSQNKLKARVVL